MLLQNVSSTGKISNGLTLKIDWYEKKIEIMKEKKCFILRKVML